MSTAAPLQLRAEAPRLRISAGQILWTVIGLMTLYVIVNNESFLVQADHPAWPRYKGYGWPLAVHAVFSAVALLVGPLQFSERFRLKYRNWHRMAGKAYVAGVLIGAPMGHYVETLQGPVEWNYATAVDAFLWTSTTLMAFYFAVRKRFDLHKQWMVRSYACALVFIYVRFFSGVLGIFGTEKMLYVLWGAIALAIFSGDVVLTWQENRRLNTLAESRKAIAAGVA